MWDTSRDRMEECPLKANSFHPTVKFTVLISETEMSVLDMTILNSVQTVQIYRDFSLLNFYSSQCAPGLTKFFLKHKIQTQS